MITLVTIKWYNKNNPSMIISGGKMTKAEAKECVRRSNMDWPHLHFWYE